MDLGPYGEQRGEMIRRSINFVGAGSVETSYRSELCH